MDAEKQDSEMLERARRDMADPNTFPGSIPYDDQEIEDDADWGVWWIKNRNGDSPEWPFDKETGQLIPPGGICWQRKYARQNPYPGGYDSSMLPV